MRWKASIIRANCSKNTTRAEWRIIKITECELYAVDDPTTDVIIFLLGGMFTLSLAVANHGRCTPDCVLLGVKLTDHASLVTTTIDMITLSFCCMCLLTVF